MKLREGNVFILFRGWSQVPSGGYVQGVGWAYPVGRYTTGAGVGIPEGIAEVGGYGDTPPHYWHLLVAITTCTAAKRAVCILLECFLGHMYIQHSKNFLVWKWIIKLKFKASWLRFLETNSTRNDFYLTFNFVHSAFHFFLNILHSLLEIYCCVQVWEEVSIFLLQRLIHLYFHFLDLLHKLPNPCIEIVFVKSAWKEA